VQPSSDSSFLKIIRSHLAVKPVAFWIAAVGPGGPSPSSSGSWLRPGISGPRSGARGSPLRPHSKSKTHGLGAFGAQRGAKRYLGHSEPARKRRARRDQMFRAEEDRRPVLSFLSKSRPCPRHNGYRSPRGTRTMPSRERLARINLHEVSFGVDKFSAQLDLVDSSSSTSGPISISRRESRLETSSQTSRT
jgi:hypothetical protein